MQSVLGFRKYHWLLSGFFNPLRNRSNCCWPSGTHSRQQLRNRKFIMLQFQRKSLAWIALSLGQKKDGQHKSFSFYRRCRSLRLKQKKFQGLDDLPPEMKKQLAYQTRQNEGVTSTLWKFEDVLTSVRKKEDSSSPIAKKRKLEDQTADDAFDYSPESRMHSSPSQQPDKRAPVGDINMKQHPKPSQCRLS
uniref:Uncharacterized protein n=1 Tax=Micrurus spixii TaxID=129469 RepID=A0A2D4NC16_9SAUR